MTNKPPKTWAEDAEQNLPGHSWIKLSKFLMCLYAQIWTWQTAGETFGWEKTDRCPADWSRAPLVWKCLPSVGISADENRHDSPATCLFRFVRQLGSILITTYYCASPLSRQLPPHITPAAFWLFVPFVCALAIKWHWNFSLEKKQ